MSNAVTTTAQTNMFGILDAGVARVFNTKEVTRKTKDGTLVVSGARLVLKTTRELEAEFSLKGKDNREDLLEKVLEQRDAAFLRVKAHISGLNGESTLHKFETKTLANGVEQTTIVTQAISRKLLIADEKIARAWGVPMDQVAEVKAMLIESAKKQAAEQVDVETVPAAE